MTVLQANQVAIGAQLLKCFTSYKYMEQFIDAGTVYLFDESAPTVAVDTVPVVAAKLQELERDLKCKVYAVIHSREWYGDCYSFLVVSKYPEDWKYSASRRGIFHYYVQAYVWNTTYEAYSESGAIVVRWHDDKLWRVG